MGAEPPHEFRLRSRLQGVGKALGALVQHPPDEWGMLRLAGPDLEGEPESADIRQCS